MLFEYLAHFLHNCYYFGMPKLDKIEELQEILKEDSENFQARRELALLLADNGFAKEASLHLRYLAEKFPDDSNIFYNLGISYEKQKLFNQAKESYLKSIELNPEGMDAVYNLGLVYIELKEFDKGIECFKKILGEDENDSNSYFNLGICYLKSGDPVSAMMNFQNTIDINDEDLYAHFYIGNILVEMGELDEAKDEFIKVTEISPDYSWAYYNLASIAFMQEDFEQVAINLDKTIELNPKDEGAYINYAKLLTQIGLYDDARQMLINAMKYCRDKGNLFYYIAKIFKQEGNIQGYITNLNNALQNRETLTLDPDTVMNELEHAGNVNVNDN